MQRVGTVLLAVLTVIVLAGAVYVINDDGGNTSDATTRSDPSRALTPTLTVTDAPSTTVVTPTSGSTASTPSSSGSSRATGSRRVVAFLGDDWTAGNGADATASRFSTLLSTRLGVTEKNFGVNGTGYAKSSTGGGDYTSRASDVIAAHPDVVVVSGGRNDWQLDPATVGADARSLFSALTAGLASATILVIAPFWGDSDKPAQLVAVATAVQQAATGAGATYVDLADPIHGHPDDMADDADPDDSGYAAIAAALRADPTVAAALGAR